MRSKVIDSARDLGLDVNVQRLSDTRVSIADTAAAIGCGSARIASCAVYVADGDPIVCVSSADCPVDSDLLADALDVAEIRLASDGETRAATGFGRPAFRRSATASPSSSTRRCWCTPRSGRPAATATRWTSSSRRGSRAARRRPTRS